jgi:adenine-specific DNA-methyltransferase
MAELEGAFSVEAVTNEFFQLYCEKFYQLSDWLTKNEDFLAEAERCGFTVEQYAKKLLGQIVFLYFLQKKGWLGVGVGTRRSLRKNIRIFSSRQALRVEL